MCQHFGKEMSKLFNSTTETILDTYADERTTVHVEFSLCWGGGG